MKKILTLLFLLILQISFSQAIFNLPFSNAPGLNTTYFNNSGLSLSHSSGALLNEVCSNRALVRIKFDREIDFKKDYTFDDEYYTLQFKLYGFNNKDDVPTLIETIDIDDSNLYQIYSNGEYFYKTDYYDLPEPYFTSYALIPVMKLYRLVGFPDMMSYQLWTKYANDDIIYDEDRCEEGTTDNNNPDPDPNAKPNLTVSGYTVKVGSKTYDPYGKQEIPEFKHGEEHTFSITIKNDGDASADASKLSLLVSEGHEYPIGNKPIYTYRTSSVSSINAGATKTINLSDYFYDNISLLNLVENKSYYMFIVVDSDNDITESNENINDNVHGFEFKYKKSTTGKVSLTIRSTEGKSTIIVNYNNSSSINRLYLQNIYHPDVNYKKTIDESNPVIDISNFYTGFYGIYVNNIFIKKVSIITNYSYSGGDFNLRKM